MEREKLWSPRSMTIHILYISKTDQNASQTNRYQPNYVEYLNYSSLKVAISAKFLRLKVKRLYFSDLYCVTRS